MVTGIEIGPGYCVLVRARLRDNDVEVTAARVLEGPDWAEDGALQVAQLRDLRRELHLPKRAAVVAWNEVRKASEFSAETVITAAGFDLRQVLSPTDALGLLASADPRATDAATAWLSINDHGAAIAVVHGREIVHAREFPWRIQASEQRVQAHLLRRYLYVAQLTPEVRRAIDIVRQERGVEIDRAITCGTVPDLRSLTMPLIRELDIEFETLDSMEGLRSPAAVASFHAFTPSAPARDSGSPAR